MYPESGLVSIPGAAEGYFNMITRAGEMHKKGRARTLPFAKLCEIIICFVTS